MKENNGIPEEFLAMSEPANEAAPEQLSSDVNPEDLDPSVILMEIMAKISEIQMATIAMNTRMSNLESHVSYLLSKDPEFVEALERMQRDVALKNQEGQTSEPEEK